MSNKIVVLGGGESGSGAAVLAKVKGCDVFVSDSGPIRPAYKERLDRYGIEYEEGKHTLERILEADEIIKSPGIPDRTTIMQAVLEKEIPVISEIEFAGRYTDAYKICITGSNGKTTTTTLIYYMMGKAGMNVGLAGNVGQSFALQVAEQNFDYYVLELSSFQLEGMYQFKADIAILLNITPDHLDRYDHDYQKYIDAKMRIVRNLSEDEYFIFCSDDDVTIRELEKIVLKAQMLPVSLKQKEDPGGWIEDNLLHMSLKGNDFTLPVTDLALKGKHNLYNSLSAGITGQALRIRKENIREALCTFPGVEHRLEYVLQIRGIHFINDSKATNINSSWYALESMTTPVVWIAGGTDKGNDYSELSELARSKVKALVCLGKDNSKLVASFGDIVPQIVETRSMKDAVAACYHLASPGDTVLLSPACASFDLFQNYEDRGRQFKECVKNL